MCFKGIPKLFKDSTLSKILRACRIDLVAASFDPNNRSNRVAEGMISFKGRDKITGLRGIIFKWQPEERLISCKKLIFGLMPFLRLAQRS